MKFRFSRNVRASMVLFVTLLVIFELFAYVITTPVPTEQFLQIYVLGVNHAAVNYFPRNDSDIKIGETMVWYIGLADNMDTFELVSVRVKIANMTISPPNDEYGLESPAPVLTDFDRFLQSNETWEFRFVWDVWNATKSNGTTRILDLGIGNDTYQIADWSAKGGYNFRLIFELWTWETESNAFEFGWSTNGEPRTAWVQIWFNMTNPSPYSA
jgi:hypothetical protein